MGKSNYVFPGKGLVATQKPYCDFLQNYIKTKFLTSPLCTMASSQKAPLQIDDFLFLPDHPVLLGKDNILTATELQNVILQKNTPIRKTTPQLSKKDSSSNSDSFEDNPFFKGNFI